MPSRNLDSHGGTAASNTTYLVTGQLKASGEGEAVEVEARQGGEKGASSG